MTKDDQTLRYRLLSKAGNLKETDLATIGNDAWGYWKIRTKVLQHVPLKPCTQVPVSRYPRWLTCGNDIVSPWLDFAVGNVTLYGLRTATLTPFGPTTHFRQAHI